MVPRYFCLFRKHKATLTKPKSRKSHSISNIKKCGDRGKKNGTITTAGKSEGTGEEIVRPASLASSDKSVQNTCSIDTASATRSSTARLLGKGGVRSAVQGGATTRAQHDDTCAYVHTAIVHILPTAVERDYTALVLEGVLGRCT